MAKYNPDEFFSAELNVSEKPTTSNADRIRAMSDEELADKLWSIAHYEQEKRCISDWLDWLKQEVAK